MSTIPKNNLKKKTTGLSKNGTKKKTAGTSGTALGYSARELKVRNDSSKPLRFNTESKEEREKRLAKLKKLTLKVLQTVYENHQKEKV